MNKPTRRVRGNSEPPKDDDLPISYWAPDEPEPEPANNDTVDFLLAFAIIVGCIVVVSWAFGRGLV